MTNDDIIRMAREAGLIMTKRFGEIDGHTRFAKLVAAAEREACAKVCDGWPDYDVQGLAEAIRARGKE